MDKAFTAGAEMTKRILLEHPQISHALVTEASVGLLAERKILTSRRFLRLQVKKPAPTSLQMCRSEVGHMSKGLKEYMAAARLLADSDPEIFAFMVDHFERERDALLDAKVNQKDRNACMSLI